MGKRIQDDESQILVQVDEDDGARQPFASIKRWLVIASLFIVSLLCIGYHPGLPAVISSSLDPHHTQLPSASDDIPIPPGISLGRCANWTSQESDPTYPSPEEFFVNLDWLTFLQRGSLSRGSITVIKSEVPYAIPHNQAKIKVFVVGFENSSVPLDLVKVCSIRDQYSSVDNGVGIFDAARWAPDPSKKINFFISIELPFMGLEPVKVRLFKVDAYYYSLTFTYLENVNFDVLTAFLSGAQVSAVSLSVGAGWIRTANGEISGTFNTYQRLTMETSNAPIDVRLNLLYNRIGFQSSVVMSTYAGNIRATANLISNVANHNGSFGIYGGTTTGDVYISVLNAPMGHKLDIRSHIVRNSLGHQNTVTLPPTYEGDFRMEAPFLLRQILDSKKEDPTGQNRTRRVRWDWKGLFAENGTVEWEGSELSERGSVELKASHGATRILI